MMDDLRALLPPQRLAGGGGGLTSATPNIDRLARDGVVFPNAYCQVSVCAPSRSSFMSGRRPDSMRVWQWESDFRKALGAAAVSLPQHFKNHGYLVVGAGKTYEPDYPARYDQPYSWSPEPTYLPLRKDTCGYQFGSSLASALTLGLRPRKAYQLSACADGGADRAFFEHACASFAIDAMRLATDVLARPFFVAAGFYKPHLPWRVPERFARRFATSDARGAAPLPPAATRAPPAGMPDVAWSAEGFPALTLARGREANEGIRRPMRAAHARAGRAAYAAAAAWSDAQLGRALDALDALGSNGSTRDATVALVTSDHGYHLGEQGSWGKHTNFELGVRTPFVLRAPWWSRGAPRARGAASAAFVELVDVYRTLAELCRLAPPGADVEGKSVAPAARATPAPTAPPPPPGARRFALSQYPRCPASRRAMWKDSVCKRVDPAAYAVMGYSLRTPGWRFTAWYRWNGGAPPRGEFAALAEELYAYDEVALSRGDLDATERFNWAAALDGAAGLSPNATDARSAAVAACARAALRPALELLVASPSAGCDGGSATDAGCVPSSAELARRLGDALACGDAARVAVSAATPKPNCAALRGHRARGRVSTTRHIERDCLRTRGA